MVQTTLITPYSENLNKCQSFSEMIHWEINLSLKSVSKYWKIKLVKIVQIISKTYGALFDSFTI